MRRFPAVLVALLAATVLAGFAPPASASSVTYQPPVDGRVVDGFRPPKTPYGSGNRGLTYETAEGAPVRAAAPGRVTFAGAVGRELHVVVQHADGVRTSYSFLRTVQVRQGAVVKAGEKVGTANPSFHFGARIGDAYIDPAILLEYGLARVYLVPDGEFKEDGADNDFRALLMAAADRMGSVSIATLAWARDATATATATAAAAAAAAAALAVPGLELLGGATREMVLHLITVLDQIVNLGQMAGPFAAFAAAMADILQAFIEACTPPAVAKPTVSEPRIAVFVAGLGSSSEGPGDDGNLSKRLRADEIYGASRVYDFSYRGGRFPEKYEAKDTVRDIRTSAADLRALLDQIAQEQPGVPVDLIAHSQGGLVAREALATDYDGPGRVLPPVARLVTLGTPHHGSDGATLNAWLRWTPYGRAVRNAIGDRVTEFDIRGKSLAQLSETSDFIKTLNNRSLRKDVAYTSIAAEADYIVPAVRARLAGASNVLVSTDLKRSHSGLTESDAAHRELALAAADMAPTCQPLAVTARRAAVGAAIATAQDGLGAGIAGAAARQ